MLTFILHARPSNTCTRESLDTSQTRTSLLLGYFCIDTRLGLRRLKENELIASELGITEGLLLQLNYECTTVKVFAGK